jgi:ribosome biogenesis protein BMS1
MPDPCPLPLAIKRRSLNDKDRLIYVPMADVSGLLFDKDNHMQKITGKQSIITGK